MAATTQELAEQRQVPIDTDADCAGVDHREVDINSGDRHLPRPRPRRGRTRGAVHPDGPVRIGQGVAAVPDEATAFSHRDAGYLFHPISGWADPADDGRMIATNRAFAAAMRPFSTGASYLNFTVEPDRVRDGYGNAKYTRLVAVKDACDPTNLFRLNQNIRPSQAAAEPALA